MSNVFNWKSFFYSVNNNGIVPIIGNDLSMVRILKSELSNIDISMSIMESVKKDGNHIIINLYDYLALRIWDIFGYGNPPKRVTLNSVVQRLEDINVLENDIDNAIKNEVANLTDDQIVMDSYRKLVKIIGFDNILAINIDNFLERAFMAEGIRFNDPVNYCIPISAVDQKKRHDKALVNIYNIMGNIQGNNFATTEEQALEYLYMLQSGSESMAKPLFDAIKGKSILLIGCSLPNWFMRFFLRTISKERFKSSSKSKYVASDRTAQDSDLSNFLENNATKVIRIGSGGDDDDDDDKSYNNSMEFIDEMYAEWIKNAGIKRNEVRFKESVFLSYSWDDKSIVEKLKNEFEKNGVNVFFDDDELKTGDRFNQVIKKYIKDCDFFVPLISRNAIEDQTRYVYSKEWNCAIVLDDYLEKEYLRPYILDDTEPTDERIPEGLRNLNIVKISSSDDFGPMVRQFIKENELTSLNN